MKLYRNDVIAILIAIAVMIFTALVLPYGSAIIRALICLIAGGLVFLAYYMIRKPDEVLELQDSLLRIARNAQIIANLAKNDNTYEVSEILREIANKTAHIVTKCLKRDLTSISVEIYRLKNLTDYVITILKVLIGDVALPQSQLNQEIHSIKHEKIPFALETLQNIEVSTDKVEADKYNQAEHELEMLRILADHRSKAGEAAQILLEIFEETSNLK